MARREFDLIIWGATGFTGQLVAEYLAQNYGVGGDLNWAIGGRNQDKLEQVRTDCLAPDQREQLPLVIADSADRLVQHVGFPLAVLECGDHAVEHFEA